MMDDEDFYREITILRSCRDTNILQVRAESPAGVASLGQGAGRAAGVGALAAGPGGSACLPAAHVHGGGKHAQQAWG